MSIPARQDPGSVPPFAALLQAFMRRARLAVALPMAGAVLGAVLVYFFRGYNADATFSPTLDRNGGQMGGLVEQLGLPVSLSGSGNSPEFYRALIYSRDVLRELATTQFHFAVKPGSSDSLTGNFVELYHVKGKTPDDKLTRATSKLRGGIKVGIERGANMVSFRLRAKWPGLAEQMARQLLVQLNDFNLGKRQSRFAAERRFSEAQMNTARDDLDVAEAAQAHFLERNRSYRDDPALNIQYQRLSRRVDLAQQAYTSIAQAYQQARLEEVRNTALFTIVQTPEHSAIPTMRLRTGIIIGFIIGAVAAIGIVLFGEYVSRERLANPQAYEQITAMLPLPSARRRRPA